MKPKWSTLKVEVVYAPQTGVNKPWEVWGFFSHRRVHWGSCKTEDSAKKIAARHIAKASCPAFIQMCKDEGIWD